MEPPLKRAKTLGEGFSGISSVGDSVIDSMGDLMETMGSKKSYFKNCDLIRIITEALYSLGLKRTGDLLQEESGIPLHSSIVKLFLDQVKKGEWDQSIATLQEIELKDEKPVIHFFLLEQKFFEFFKMKKDDDALKILKEDMTPLGVNNKRREELAFKLLRLQPNKDAESVNSESEVVEKLQNMLPPTVIIPEKRLQYLVERSLDYELDCCAFHNIPDNDMSIYSDHHCGIHKIPSKTVQTLEGHTDEVWFLKFSHNGKYLASSSKDKSAIIWEIAEEGTFSEKHKLLGHEKPVVMVLWSPDDKQVVTCGENEVIRRWDVESGGFIQSYERNGVGSVSCGWFHDGSGIIGGMTDRNICLWNLDGTEIEHEAGQREHKLSDVAMTSDGWLVSVDRVREISFFNRVTGAVSLIPEEDMITSFSLSKDDESLLVNLNTPKIHLWNVQTGKLYDVEYIGHKRSLRSCFGGYKDGFIASGSEDSKVYIWRIREQRGEPCRVLRGHSGAVNCVSWNPIDLHMLASASDDRTIMIWGT